MSICITIVILCSSLHERLCWVFRTLASHSGVFSLVSRPWHSWLSDLLCISIILPRKFLGCILRTSSTAFFNFLYKSTYTGRKKNAGPNQRKVNPNRNVTKKYYTNTSLLQHGFRVPASWGLKKIFKVSTLSFHAGMAGERLLGLLSSTTSDGGSLPRFRMKLPSRTVWKCGSAHSNSYMVHAW